MKCRRSTDDKSSPWRGAAAPNLGTGGMVTKLHAAQIATEAGCEMVIANGWNPAAAVRHRGGRTHRHPIFGKEGEQL